MSRIRSFRQVIARSATIRVAIGTCVLLVLGSLAGAPPASAGAAPQAAAPVDLGTAAGFSVLAGPSIANTGSGTVLALDLGVTGTLAGFPPGTVKGEKHVTDATAATAHEDRQAAYDAVAAQVGGTPFSGDLAGQTFTPGLYSTAAAVTNTGTITLDAAGDPSGIFVFQIGAALSSAASTKVVLKNGALAHNVYWQVVGAVALGADAKFVGTLLGAGVVSFGDNATLKGRILTASTVALSNNPIAQPIDDLVEPLVAVNGGATRATSDPTPAISGTTDEPGTPLVTVTVGSQVLSTRALDGAWALSANALAEGPHEVLASVTDPSQNTGSATQVLTVDTARPGVTLTGGDTAATKDVTPTISGSTDEPGTPTVTVTVAGQTLTTTAGAGGAWTVDAGTLTERSHFVRASVDDAAGNTGTNSQVLTVDLTVPVLTIDGGATRSTSDTSPWTYGTTAEQAGTIVQVRVGGQTLSATVQSGGTWGVSAQSLSSGTYTVLASITDAAQNTGSFSQTLQVGSVVTQPIPPGTTPPGNPPVIPPDNPPVTPPVNQPAAAAYRADAEIRMSGRGFIGKGTYGGSRQRVTSGLKGRVRAATFEIRLTNRGNRAETMAVRGVPSSARFAVAYLAQGRNVTTAVLSGRYRTVSLASGRSTTLSVRVTRLKRAKKGNAAMFTVRAASTHDGRRTDTVGAGVKVLRR